MTAVRFRQRRVRRWWYLGITLTAFVLFAVIFVTASSADNPSGCDFAANGTTESCSGPLTGSTFAGGDGNLLASPTTFGSTDWSNVAGLNVGIDNPSGSTDNAFGQGTKEDDANVTVVSGSIPPNKSDLTRFYDASQYANGSNFLYLAWERTNNLGSANMDFEINQATTPGLGNPGPHTINRTAGDLLVTFDFTNGGGTPALALLKWVTSGATSQCFSSNSLPCWGNRVVLNGTNSIGAVNNLDAVTDPIQPNSGTSQNPVGALRFGEPAINLTAAGVFPPGTCEAFGSVFLKSRSSASFPAEVKDFVAPVPVNISNCGRVTIIKHTNPRGQNQDFSFTSNIPSTAGCTLDTTPASFTLNDSAGVDPAPPITTGTANTEHCDSVFAGTYTVTEGADPANFAFESLTCSAGGVTSGKTATITVAPNSTVTCIYTNKLQTGAIQITKTRKHAADGPGDHAHAGVTFTVNGVSKQTDANGVACFDGLLFGTYTVHETVPAGYHVDANDKQVTVDNTATCSGSPYVG